MPLVQITLLKGKSTAYVRAVADGIHQALVETFETPSKDRFQVIHQMAQEDFIVDSDYLNVHRTDDAIVILITASKTRSTATKQAFYKAVTDNLSRNPGVRPQDVQIILSPNEREDWSFGNGIASYVPVEGR